ncbi:hypothetical protein [Lactobacillus delbrueckii]|jgi:MFS family permease|uniref:hypothetical protein n=1 Tax=Lactobacillus delbrueckii TaxID=1584 RepID=UPI001F3CE7CB|nr:hypothetical protein [Lactobacillus delbrueckii]MCI1658834.1 hypothetical protein [Lactobacillus delbrueckii]MCI1706675.1 hypothetical protein [Lactobacillus delbrueckii]MCI1789846.1 hypothetical protein [Lactobacillus delbrueckii]MCI1929473.1 hypothetical protein [Lactobacillus delbrueckii]MCI1949407.1 hypothetical protein [Lactobacillus delbrueckii]
MEAHEKVAPSVIWSIIAAGMIVALAPSLGPTYGGICQSALNWRFNFVFTLPITIAFCIIATCFMSDNEAHRDHFN